jgi:hypothetical protein
MPIGVRIFVKSCLFANAVIFGSSNVCSHDDVPAPVPIPLGQPDKPVAHDPNIIIEKFGRISSSSLQTLQEFQQSIRVNS